MTSVIAIAQHAAPMMEPRRKTTYEGRPVVFRILLTSRWPIWPEMKPKPTHLGNGER
jgi:hypothetical protein